MPGEGWRLDRAVDDFEAALRVAPPDWPRRESMERRFKRARDRQ
jgi:cytochrome c-type biogenesis protein CcmH/NrfG